MLTTIHHLQKYDGPNTGHFDNPRPDLDPGCPPEDEVETHLGAIEAPRPMGFGTLPQVRKTAPPPESKTTPSQPRPKPPSAPEEPDSDGSEDESDDNDETMKKPPDLPLTSPSSEQEEDSSQEEGDYLTPNVTLSSIPGQPEPDGNILGGLDLNETPTPGYTPPQVRPPQVTSTPDTSTQPLPTASLPLVGDPRLFPDVLEEPDLGSPTRWPSPEASPALSQWPSPAHSPAVSPSPPVEPAPDDDAILAARLLDRNREAANIGPFEGRLTRAGRRSFPPPRFKPDDP